MTEQEEKPFIGVRMKHKDEQKEEDSMTMDKLREKYENSTSENPAEEADADVKKDAEEADDDVKDEDLFDEKDKMEADMAERSKKDDAPAKKKAEKKAEKEDFHDLVSKLIKAQARSKYLETQVKALGRVTLSKATEKELKLALKWRREKRTYEELSKYLEEHFK